MRVPVRGLLRVLLLVPCVTLAAGCFDQGGEVRVYANGTQVAGAATESPAAKQSTPAPAGARAVAALAFTPTPYESDLDPNDLSGFAFPITDACLPSRDEVMPNAPRAYRDGVHEGVDFYDGDVCTPIALGTPVRAMYPGVVIRADRSYEEITQAQVDALAAKTATQGFSDPETLDVYRGRQVWVDHGNGIVTRYAHLSAIADGIDRGVEVAAGQVLGEVGESGTPESVTAPGTEIHLHAEVRLGDGFLGEGLPPDEVRRLYTHLFGVAASPVAVADTPVAPAETPDEAAVEATPAAGDPAPAEATAPTDDAGGDSDDGAAAPADGGTADGTDGTDGTDGSADAGTAEQRATAEAGAVDGDGSGSAGE